ncbi:high mobility group protein 20A-like isoform X3 [Daphnia pulex]|uniref:high mobility group protein 20A-like isoform X3 n=1 Tax=Daphnia pulex TaxID=6669 RepID=UPI001EDD2B18|nr:high mobility group protein 20A-like isoform X3 [Daphnia pulex]XP_046639935.1 high mobility group protein 20A-like isoform X3 [Daphnia pulicaria]
MEGHHQQSNATNMHQQHTNPEPTTKNRSAGGGGAGKTSKKRKRNQDLGPGAPRQPVNGYVRFLNERREQVRAANPSAGFADIMKIMAQEWTQLPAEEKQKYMQAAEQDRQRYQKELQEYQQTEAYKSYVQQQQQQHVQQQLHLQQQQRQAMQATHQSQSQQQPAAHSSHSQVQAQPYIQQIQSYNPQLHIVQHMQPGQHQQHGDRSNNAAGHRPDGSGNQVGVFDIPIFTEEFLDHNKVSIAPMHGSGYSFLPITLKPFPSNPVMFDVAFQNDSIVDAKRAKLPMCHFLV